MATLSCRTTSTSSASAAVFRVFALATSRPCPHTLRTITFSSSRRQSSKRELYTAPAYQPHTLPDAFPIPPRNTSIPETSIGGPSSAQQTRSQRPPESNEQGPSNIVSEVDAQQSAPVPEKAAESKKARRSKLKPRKAAMKISATAIDHLRDLVDQPNPQMIRVGVKNRGCSGLAYHLEYVDKPGTFDEVVEQDGVKVLIDSKALFSIIGSEMDWQEDKLSARFVFKNPNITEQCGCGESFSVS